MAVSDYVSGYISEARIEFQKAKEPWLKNFFKEFGEELLTRSNGASPGDKYVITGAFSKALPNLIPDRLRLIREAVMKNYIDLPEEAALSDLLSRKRIDFAIEGKEKTLLVEFKTNVQFNDIAAAMVEMLAVKKFATKNHCQVITASLHLFPYRTNVEGIRSLNDALEKPLEHIWVMCTPELKYDIAAIKSFRKDISDLVG